MRDPNEQSIPARVIIGVTGHRRVDSKKELINGIHSAIGSIRKMVPPMRKTPLILSVLCPLAEGADRLVAREVLSIPGSILEVILPMDKDDYLQDFETSESRAEFEELLGEAKSIRQLSTNGSRPEIYDQVGRYVVDQCDVLIALWDGKDAEGHGGTGDIVEYARNSNCPLIWVNTENPGKVTVEPGNGLDTRPFEGLDKYNSDRISTRRFNEQLKAYRDSLYEHARQARFPYERLNTILEFMLVHLIRTDLLALRYQHLYYRTGTSIYILAAAAVLLAAFKIIFMPHESVILIAEIVLMIKVLVIYWLGHRRKWHSKWLDYRFLAERLRSALFIAMTDIEMTTLRPPRHLSLSYSSNDWMIAAFSSIWSRRPRYNGADALSTEGLRHLLREAWIENQIRYQELSSKRNLRKHRRMSFVSNTLFGLTLLVAFLHIINIGPHYLKLILAFMAIALPTIAASIAAIRTHRDYLRISMRSAEMAGHLKELEDQMMRTQELEPLLRLIADTEQTMLHESEDWRVVVKFHEPELPV